MGRHNVKFGLAESLKQAGGFDALSAGGTVVMDDHRVLSQGVNRAAIVVYERFDQNELVFGNVKEMIWELEVEVFIRHNSDVIAARKDADTYVQAIIDRINADHTLGGSAFNAVVVGGRLEEERFMVAQRIPFYLEVLTVRATEHL